MNVCFRVARSETQKSGIQISKFSKKPERFLRVIFHQLKCVFLNQMMNNVILYLYKIYLNETKENLHQNIVN
jgi:hypothetical protein